jgi:hypothetical protein
MRRIVFIISILSLGTYYWWTHHPITHGPGIIAPHTPEQRMISNAEPFSHQGYKIIPLAHFEIEARLLSKKKYSYGRESELSPIDLALGWGPMSDEALLEHLDINQSSRFYYWWTTEPSVPLDQVSPNSANMHMVPSSPDIAKRLKKIRKGHIISLEGYLIKAEANDGWHWKSSLTRTDTGAGSCEVVWVENLKVVKNNYLEDN